MRRLYSGEGLLGQFMNLFVPDPISSKVIPSDIQEAVVTHLGGDKHKWYCFVPSADGALVAVDFERAEPEPAGRFLHVGLWKPADGPTLVPAVDITGPVRFDKPYGCHLATEAATGSFDTPCDPDQPSSVPVQPAGGWVWDRRATLVLGITRDGQEVTVEPRNGCWLLVPPDGLAGEWREFQVKDRLRRVIYGREL